MVFIPRQKVASFRDIVQNRGKCMQHLFDSSKKIHAPLADRMRPQNLDEIVGQEHLLGPRAVLRSLIDNDRLCSFILWGPPGSGKTTLALLIAQSSGAHFVKLSAVNAGVKDIRHIIDRAREELKLYHKKTILFIDEIHRFNKAQQDALLPAVEGGDVILIGATTENPSFEVNAALLSRSRVFVLHPLSQSALERIFDRALSDRERGIRIDGISFLPTAKDVLLSYANGDARTLLNILELVSILAHQKGIIEVDLPILEEAAQNKMLRYDKAGDEHYAVISAFIKSMRNSDPDAALYWLARMIDAGEDPLFIARRMIVFSSEDIGNADSQALIVANAVAAAAHMIGMPEARITLAQGVVYLAEAPKSNRSYAALNLAMEDVKEYGNLQIPLHLRNATTQLMKDLDYGKGYRYAHDFENKKTDMQCLPDELKERKYLQLH